MLRPALPTDAPRIAEIYAHYVAHTAISFELVPPSEEEMRQRIVEISAEYPYLVAEEDGCVVGYAYAHRFHPRAALAHCVESSVYIYNNVRGKGIGSQLMDALEAECRRRGFLNIYASIATTDTADPHLPEGSLPFHLSRGYSLIGTFHRCGHKFDHWYDLTWVGKYL